MRPWPATRSSGVVAGPLIPASLPWRVRRYAFTPDNRRATKVIETFFEFGSDADMIAFRLRWI